MNDIAVDCLVTAEYSGIVVRDNQRLAKVDKTQERDSGNAREIHTGGSVSQRGRTLPVTDATRSPRRIHREDSEVEPIGEHVVIGEVKNVTDRSDCPQVAREVCAFSNFPQTSHTRVLEHQLFDYAPRIIRGCVGQGSAPSGHADSPAAGVSPQSGEEASTDCGSV